MKSSNSVKVSVIMGVYCQKNQEQLLAAVSSILNQTMNQLEFIIYQDGYEEETRATLKSMSERDNRIVLMGEKENHGLAYALNRCIEAAKGEYIARMDADDISLPERLETQLVFLEKHPQYAFCGSNAELIDEQGIWGKRKMAEEPEKKDYLPFSPYIHPTVMFRRSALEKSNGYRYAKVTMRCEDYDLFMRLYILGEKGYNIQQCLLQYREDRNSYQKRKYRYRIDEFCLRFRGFKKMGLWNAKGLVYTVKPLIVGMIPSVFLEKRKQRQERWEPVNEKEPKVI